MSSAGGEEEMSDEGLDTLINAMEHLKKPDEEEKSFEEKLAVRVQPEDRASY